MSAHIIGSPGDNMMPGDNSGADPSERGFGDEDMEIAFQAGAQQMREMLARFVEQGGSDLEKKIAQSMRLNWVPKWGTDPGPAKDVYDDLWAAW